MTFTYLYHPATGGGTLVPNDPDVVAHYVARGWVEDDAPSSPSDDVRVVTWGVAPALVARALGWKIADDYSLDLTGATTHTASQVQAWLDDAAASGTSAYAAGTIKCDGTVTVKGDADLHLLTLNYTGTGTAIRVGDPASQLFRKRVAAPHVVATAKTALGWGQVAGSVGVQVANAYGCAMTFPWVRNFETGVLVTGVPIGAAIQGTQQCVFYPQHLDNNKVNFRVAPFVGSGTSDSGWANQNTVVGGRFSHDSNEGPAVAGAKHVDLASCPNVVNGWVFYGSSLESSNVVDYHIDTYSWNCSFRDCRFENTGGDAARKVRSRGTAKGNQISRGFNAGQITQSVTDTALPFDTDTDVQLSRRGGSATVPAILAENLVSSSGPVLTIMEAGAALAGTDPATGYAVRASAQQWAGKRAADANARIIVDAVNGRTYYGDATAAPVGFIGGSASTVFVGGSLPFVPLANGTQDCGITSLKWRYVRAGTAVQTGAVASGSRPAAATAGAGAMVFDTTLNKPVWSDGTNWRDATGTVV